MWGPDGSHRWLDADPSTPANLEKLQGTELFVTAGVPRPGGATNGPAVADPAGGGALESVVAQCTRRLQDATEALGIPAIYRYPPGGLHDWPYWERSLHEAWPSFARALAD